MVAPIVGWAAAAAGGAVIGGIIGTGTSVVSALYISPAIKPSERAAIYLANFGNPNLLPSAEALTHAYYYGTLDNADYVDALQRLGVVFAPGGGIELGTIAGRCWSQVIKANLPKLPMELVLSAKAQGLLSPQEVSDQLRISGFYKQEIVEAFMNRQWAPSYQEALRQLYLGVITEDDLEIIAKRIGITRQSDKDLMRAMTDPVPLGMVFDMYNRTVANNADFHHFCLASGYRAPHVRDKLQELADTYTIPTPSDLVRFAVREAFSGDVAQSLGLYQEYPQDIQPWATLQGWGKPVVKITSPGGGEQMVNWMQVQWAAHWQPISPSQAYEMFHKLRPSRVEAYQAAGFDVQPFGIDDVRRWLRIADYPPGIRDELAAISYRPVRLFDIRTAVQSKMIGDAEASELFQDLGYSPDSAKFSVDVIHAKEIMAELAYVKSEVVSMNRRAVKAVVKAYTAGLVTAQEAMARLAASGFTSQQSSSLLAVANAEWNLATFNETVAALKSGYLNGALSDQQTAQSLASIGVRGDKINDYVSRWRLRRTVPKRTATAAKITDWLSRGYINQADAAQRLSNLGFADPDVVLLMAEAQRKRTETEAKALASADRQQHQRASDLQRARADAIRHVRELESEIKRITPTGRLQAWVKKGIVSDKFFLDRMEAAGYPIEAANFYLREAHDNNDPTKRTGETSTGPTA